MSGFLRRVVFPGAFAIVVGVTAPQAAAQSGPTGAARLHVISRDRLGVYAAAGIGGAFGRGDMPSAALTVTYRFQVAGIFPIDEADHTTIRVTRSGNSAFATILGGGADDSWRDVHARLAARHSWVRARA